MTFTTSELLMVIAAVGVVAVNMITAWRTRIEVKENTLLTAEVSKKADVITGHVNSASDKAAAKIDALEHQVVNLVAQIAEKRETSALLAQAVAQAAAQGVTTPVAVEVVNAPSKPVPTVPGTSS